jgi:predicted DNA-binding protein (MmcQ/YjbR family)
VPPGLGQTGFSPNLQSTAETCIRNPCWIHNFPRDNLLDHMSIDWVRQLCLPFPHVTEQVQWDDVLVFKVGGKMFAIAPLEAADQWIAFKCSPEEFAELTERPGIIPAPYLARAYWISIESESVLRRSEVEALLRRAHELVFAKLPKTHQQKLLQSNPRKPNTTRKPRRRAEI